MDIKKVMHHGVIRNKELGYKRADRNDVHGEKIAIQTRNAWIDALIYRKELGHELPIIFEVHGGGFMYNTSYDDDELCHYISEHARAIVIACNYRTTPEYPYPTGLYDVYDTIKYVLLKKDILIDREKIVIWGHSAGANLAAATVLLASEKKEFVIQKQILDYPYLNISQLSKGRPKIFRSVPGFTMDTFAYYYVDNPQSNRSPYVSPVYASKKQLEGVNETYILLCGRDNLNIDGKEYQRILEAADKPVVMKYYQDALHGFIENAYNYKYVSWNVRMNVGNKQRKMAVEAVDEIIKWVSAWGK